MIRLISFVRSLGVPLALPLLLASCSDCAPKGCDGLKTAAAQNGSGVAGAILAESDVVKGGCGECTSGSAGIEIWPNDSPVLDAETARAITQATSPQVNLSGTATFSQVLEPGHYLFCVRPSCVSIQVSGATTTVNIKRGEGPTSFFVSSASGGGLSETYGFDLGE